jgi:hypothetical protein
MRRNGRKEASRDIDAKRLSDLWSRTLPVSNPKKQESTESGGLANQTNEASIKQGESTPHPAEPNAALTTTTESEPNDGAAEALTISIPTILEGAVSQPGDVDFFRIKVDAGKSVAFELQTRGAAPPRFSPSLAVLNSSGEEMLTNVYQRIGGDGDDWVQSLESKVIYTFDRGGDYVVRLGDLTSRNGSPEFKYRLLVRPLIPHVGDIAIKEDRLNLVPGEARKVTISASQEEGFDGQIAILVDNLPEGVTAVPAADVEPAPGPPWAKVHPERFVPKGQTVTLMIFAAPEAPATKMPWPARFKAQPIVLGKPGTPFDVKELPVMVQAASPTKPVGGDSAHGAKSTRGK